MSRENQNTGAQMDFYQLPQDNANEAEVDISKLFERDHSFQELHDNFMDIHRPEEGSAIPQSEKALNTGNVATDIDMPSSTDLFHQQKFQTSEPRSNTDQHLVTAGQHNDDSHRRSTGDFNFESLSHLGDSFAEIDAEHSRMAHSGNPNITFSGTDYNAETQVSYPYLEDESSASHPYRIHAGLEHQPQRNRNRSTRSNLDLGISNSPLPLSTARPIHRPMNVDNRQSNSNDFSFDGCEDYGLRDTSHRSLRTSTPGIGDTRNRKEVFQSRFNSPRDYYVTPSHHRSTTGKESHYRGNQLYNAQYHDSHVMPVPDQSRVVMSQPSHLNPEPRSNTRHFRSEPSAKMLPSHMPASRDGPMENVFRDGSHESTWRNHANEPSRTGLRRAQNALRYNSLEEYQEAHEYQAAYFNDDETIPSTPRAQYLCVARLFDAMIDTDKAEDNIDLKNSWQKTCKKSPQDLEIACWKTFTKLLQYHNQHGCLVERNNYSSKIHKFATFEEHLKAICDGFLSNKTICRHLLSADYLSSLIDDPAGARTRVENNRRVNLGKKLTNDIHKAVYSVADETTKRQARRVINASITPSTPRHLPHSSVSRSVKRELDIVTSIEGDDDDIQPPSRKVRRRFFQGPSNTPPRY